MSIKEFSQKNSEIFFYSTIVLVIVCIVLGFSVCGNRGPKNIGDRTRGQGMMQDRPNNDQFNSQNVPSSETNNLNTGTSAPAGVENADSLPTVNQ